MRLLHRLNQYQRLWQPSAGAPQQVTVGELAERCFCSERHVRTLLRQAQEAGWLSWQASSGRGKRGQLSFHKTPESLRNEMMEQALNNGQQQIALELAQLAPVELKALLHPFLGGQWQNNTPHAAYSLLSPAGAAASRLSPRPRRAASGRTNLCRADALRRRRQYADRRSGAPLAGLPDGLRWHFYIRSTLCWHNGDTVETAQLRQRLLLLLELPALRTLFASISRIDVTHAQCLTITLHRPDYWLPFRLASYCSVLAHPDDPAIGCGPFRLKRFSPELVRTKTIPATTCSIR